MRRLLAALLAIAFLLPDAALAGKTVSVRGYTRKDGTYVRPHMRSPPGGGSSGSSSGYRSSYIPTPAFVAPPIVARDAYRGEARITAPVEPTRPDVQVPPDLLEIVREIERNLSGRETPVARAAAARRLEAIAGTYEGSPEASEALRLLREIRAEEENERLANDRAAAAAKERADREEHAATKVRLGKVFLSARKPSQARTYFRQAIESYPETNAAAEAQTLLANL